MWKNLQRAINATFHDVWKSPKKSHLNFLTLAFSTNFCPIKIDLLVNLARFDRHVEWDFFVDILNTVLPSYIMFFKDSPKWHFTFKTWKSNQSFFARAQIFRRIARSITIFLLGKLTNLPLAFETVHCNANQKNISFYFFYNVFFMNQFGCCEDFFKVRDTSKKWPFSLVLKRHISFFIHKMTRQNVNLGTLFTCLFSWFVALGHKLPPTRLRHFFKSLRFAATIAFHFLFLTFQTIRRSSLDHCALL